MFLISVSGSMDELEPLWTDVQLIDPVATLDGEDHWTVVGYAEADTLNGLKQLALPVEIIKDEDTVAAHCAAALGDIEEPPPM
jgi:hypothetical protein